MPNCCKWLQINSTFLVVVTVLSEGKFSASQPTPSSRRSHNPTRLSRRSFGQGRVKPHVISGPAHDMALDCDRDHLARKAELSSQACWFLNAGPGARRQRCHVALGQADSMAACSRWRRGAAAPFRGGRHSVHHPERPGSTPGAAGPFQRRETALVDTTTVPNILGFVRYGWNPLFVLDHGLQECTR